MNKIITAISIIATFLLLSCNNPNNTQEKTERPLTTITEKNSSNRLEVFAFHGTNQCETCKSMKAHTKATLEKYFAEELKSGKIVFQIIDVDDPQNEKIAEKFQATGTALMLNEVKNGEEKIIDFSDMAFEKANEKELFVENLKNRIAESIKD